MIRLLIRTLIALGILALFPAKVEGVFHAGGVAPDFHKTDLGGNPQTLFQYRGKVVVMFLLGYS